MPLMPYIAIIGYMEISEEIRADAEKGARRLVAEFWDRLYGASLILCRDGHAAEDLVFRTFAQAILKIDQYDPSQPLWGWLYVILLNYFRGDLRKMKAAVADEADCGETALESAAEPPDRLPEMDSELVRRAVARLPPILRETVVLRYFEDKTLQEMAQLMAVPVGTVKSRLHLARRGLRKMLTEIFREGEKET